jgi:membrane protein implicated in regulation of membrane protease activity
MSSRGKVIAGGAVFALLVLWLVPGWLLTLVLLGVIAVPVAAYLMLDPSQRKRVRAQGRKRLGA